MTFAVAALFVTTWAVMSLVGPVSYSAASLFGSLTILYSGLIAMLAGSLASAEERAFGTIEWQALQPYAGWKQWGIKVSTTVILALVLALGLPIALEAIHPIAGGQPLAFWVGPRGIFLSSFLSAETPVVMLAALTVLSLYMSTLTSSTLRALLLTMPCAAIGALMAATIASRTGRAMWSALDLTRLMEAVSTTRSLTTSFTGEEERWLFWASAWILTAGPLVFTLQVLRFAQRNHRSAERGSSVVLRQGAWLTVGAAASAAAVGGIPPILLWWLVVT